MYEPGKVADLPITSPNAPLSQPRQDLWDAAQLIRKGGLCKGNEETPDGQHCWVGAMKKIAVGYAGPVRGLAYLAYKATITTRDIIEGYGPRFVAAWDQWHAVHGHYPGDTGWIGWNNLPETTAEDVAGKLEYAALS